ncbi:uncharacterized protein [Labrus bergylta]|uniref:uncharacterized protein n=1 Tax=Labrus bergylta TaxID=56723 RepID=UPI003313ED41
MVQPIKPEESSTPVQCVDDPTGLTGVVVDGERTYPLPDPLIGNNQQNHVDNSPNVGGVLEQQRPLEEILHQGEHSHSDTTNRGPQTRWSLTHLLMAAGTLMVTLMVILMASRTAPWQLVTDSLRVWSLNHPLMAAGIPMAILMVILRAMTLRAMTLMAMILRAMILRAMILMAMILRAILRAMIQRAIIQREMILSVILEGILNAIMGAIWRAILRGIPRVIPRVIPRMILFFHNNG